MLAGAEAAERALREEQAAERAAATQTIDALELRVRQNFVIFRSRRRGPGIRRESKPSSSSSGKIVVREGYHPERFSEALNAVESDRSI